MLHSWKYVRIEAVSNLWHRMPETPGSEKTLRFQDKRIPAPLYLGVRLRLASHSKYFKHSLTCWVHLCLSELQNGKVLVVCPHLHNMFYDTTVFLTLLFRVRIMLTVKLRPILLSDNQINGLQALGKCSRIQRGSTAVKFPALGDFKLLFLAYVWNLSVTIIRETDKSQLLIWTCLVSLSIWGSLLNTCTLLKLTTQHIKSYGSSSTM